MESKVSPWLSLLPHTFVLNFVLLACLLPLYAPRGLIIRLL